MMATQLRRYTDLNVSYHCLLAAVQKRRVPAYIPDFASISAKNSVYNRSDPTGILRGSSRITQRNCHSLTCLLPLTYVCMCVCVCAGVCVCACVCVCVCVCVCDTPSWSGALPQLGMTKNRIWWGAWSQLGSECIRVTRVGYISQSHALSFPEKEGLSHWCEDMLGNHQKTTDAEQGRGMDAPQDRVRGREDEQGKWWWSTEVFLGWEALTQIFSFDPHCNCVGSMNLSCRFYEDLRELLELTPKNDVLFIIGTGMQK